MVNRQIYSLLISITVGFTVVLGPKADANTRIDVSPAIESYPGELLEGLKACTANNHLFGSKYQVVNHLEAWFMAFRQPMYPKILSEVKHSKTQRIFFTKHAHIKVDEVRQLVDFRTEQAIVSMLDASIRRYGRGKDCKNTASRLFMVIAEQRDRAWAWAEVVDRYLKMNKKRWEVDRGEYKRAAESSRRLESAADALKQYRK